MQLATRSRRASPVFLAAALVCLQLASLAFSSAANGLELPVFQEVSNTGEVPFSAQALCQIGELNAGFSSIANPSWFPFELYQYIDPALCTQCPPAGGLDVRSGVWRLRPLAACTIVIEASIVEATGLSSCPTPDPTHVICPPQQLTITVPGLVPITPYAVPFAPGCCVTRPAFLRFRLVSFTCTGQLGIPISLGIQPCLTRPCAQYVYAPNAGALVPTPVCTWYPSSTPPNFLMFVDADCCSPTPTLQRSWGTVKTMYR